MKMMNLTFYVPDGLDFQKRKMFPLTINPQHILAVGDTWKKYKGPCVVEVTMSEEFTKTFSDFLIDSREFYRKHLFAVVGTPKEIVDKWNECMNG